MSQVIVTLNAGSSSIKFAAFSCFGALEERARGQIERLGVAPRLVARVGGRHCETAFALADCRAHDQAVGLVFAFLAQTLEGARVEGVGHRIVHGGSVFQAPRRLDEGVLAALEALAPLAPLHQPHNLAGVAAARAAFPDAPQVACFDTAFHAAQPFEAAAFALPIEYFERGVRRYGFHGLAYDSVMTQLAEIDAHAAHGRVIAAHLGAGCSMAAVRAGRSIATTMGFSALDGLPMATRCGRLDPAVVLHLIEQGMSPADVATLLYNQSGLKGLSGGISDMRLLLETPTPAARAAVSFFEAALAREAGALAAALEGVDCLVFSGGIGENAPQIRAGAAERLGWLGVVIDPERNAAVPRHGGRLSPDGASLAVYMLPADEEKVIAAATAALL